MNKVQALSDLTRLIVRFARRSGTRLQPDMITVIRIVEASGSHSIRCVYPLRGLRITIDSPLRGLGDLTSEEIEKVAREQADDVVRIAADESLKPLLVEAGEIAKEELARPEWRTSDAKLMEVRPCAIQAAGGWLPSPELIIEVAAPGKASVRHAIIVQDPSEIPDALSELKWQPRISRPTPTAVASPHKSAPSG